MAYLTVAEAKSFVDTDLSDAALTILLDDAARDIDLWAGVQGERTDELSGGDRDLWLPSPASSVASVAETRTWSTTEAFSLDSSDWDLVPGGRIIRRLSTGVDAALVWGPLVRVTWTPVDDAARRKRAQRDLLFLSVRMDGLKTESAGAWSATRSDAVSERNRILWTLRQNGRMSLA